MSKKKINNRLNHIFDDLPKDRFIGETGGFRHVERMIASFDGMKFPRRLKSFQDRFEQGEVAEGIAGALYEQHGAREGAQDFVAQLAVLPA